MQLKKVLQKKRSTASLIQEVTTSFELVRNNSAQAVELLKLFHFCNWTFPIPNLCMMENNLNPSSSLYFKGLALSAGALARPQNGENWAKSDTATPSRAGSKSQSLGQTLATKYVSFVMCFQVIPPDVPSQKPCYTCQISF